ncbi:MAG: hypothetical protein IT460_09850 [Planctomycetes bacterium]|nr:hypothetical protein [Planctomycetota bacterium]
MSERAVPPEPAIHRAARTGDHAAIERLLAAGADVDEPADLEFDHGPHLRGLTPLLTAARSIDGATVATLRLLLDRGANLHARAEGGGDAAWYAAGTGMRIPGLHTWRVVPEHVERLRFLLDAGLSPTGRNASGSTCLCEACGAGDPARVTLLLERGVRPGPDWGAEDSAAYERSTRALFGAQALPRFMPGEPPAGVAPLFRAAESGSSECVDRLLAAGASVTQRDEDGSTALAHARSPAVVRALVRAGADVQAVDEWRKDPLAAVLDEASGDGECLEPGLFEVARALVEAGAALDRVPGRATSRLWDAAFSHNADAVEFLLSMGLRPMPDSRDGQTPLHAIAWQGECDHAPKNAACERIIRALVAAGNPVDARDEHGRTPLGEAHGGDWRNDTAIRVLLELGADPGGGRAERGK